MSNKCRLEYDEELFGYKTCKEVIWIFEWNKIISKPYDYKYCPYCGKEIERIDDEE